jgi:hypothetical protein
MYVSAKEKLKALVHDKRLRYVSWPSGQYVFLTDDGELVLHRITTEGISERCYAGMSILYNGEMIEHCYEDERSEAVYYGRD